MITSDFHMHTDFSSDCEAPARDMIEGAVSKGLKTICITDHNDKDYPFHEDIGPKAFIFDIDHYFEVLRGLKEEYADKIDVRIGIEIGLQPHLGAYYKELVNKYPFDFVIGSVHVVHGSDPYYREMFQGRSDEEAYRETFQATLEDLDAVDDFDVLGHIDYVVRYGNNQAQEYSYRKYADQLDEILKKVIAKGKGIEMNMAGFKYGLGFCHPHPDIIRRYRELGGEIITIGADGHRPEHIAYDFEKAAGILKDCGFKYYTEFSGRKPKFEQLP
ncbi:PHP domain-containing protein [Clostridium sp. AF19-22AC]|jgi:histidinol-phosphatase (PHP family)|uniref:histidinol-phosphatase HisJ family protein n=1 Tax=Clostridia TaxID=186801 RepID=UPI000E530559|nr:MULTISPECIES: histidinol-phosphatase HisJ family protein [Clostridia]RHR25227.1 PHP domain-containing protein [Clostridium sp. AF19-22AC]